MREAAYEATQKALELLKPVEVALPTELFRAFSVLRA